MLGPAGAGAGAGTRENFTVLQIAVWSRARGAQLIASRRPRTQPVAGMQGQSSALSINPLLLPGYGLPHSELSWSANGSFAKY